MFRGCDALVMSEGAPKFHEERGLFVLTIPIGGDSIRIGFLPHDFIRACHESKHCADAFMQRQQEPLRMAS